MRKEGTTGRQSAALLSFLQLLYGVSAKESNRYDFLIVSDGSGDISGVDGHGFDNGEDTLLVAPRKPDGWKGDYLVFDGGIGKEGDQTVIDGTMIIETVSYDVLPYLQISGPTYVIVEGDADRSRFLEDVRRFSMTGQLPAYLTSPGIIMEVGTVLGCCASHTKRRFVRGGVTISTLDSDDSILSHPSDDVRVRAFAAAIFLVQASASNSQIVFSPLSEDERDVQMLLAYDEANRSGVAVDVVSGRLFGISADAFRVLNAVRRGKDAIDVVSREFNLDDVEIEHARRRVLQRMGIND